MRNPFHLLEQALVAGPGGDDMKGDPTPFDWDIFYDVVDDMIAILRERLGARHISPKYAVPVTPASTRQGLRVSHVLENSAAEPFFSDVEVKSTKKRANLRKAFSLAKKFAGSTSSLPLWPADAFARGDRVGTMDLVKDDDATRGEVILEMKDRLIAGQSFVLQILDGVFTQALSEALAAANIPEIDMREPWLLSDWFEEGMNVVKSLPHAKSIGTDESAWDQHLTPQLWYGVYLVYKALFPETIDIVFGETHHPLIFNANDARKVDGMSSDSEAVFDMIALVGEEERQVPVHFTKIRVTTEDLLRRVFAGASGTGFRFGNVLVDGYTQVVDTPRDGKIQLGWSMRSGNWMTFLANSIANWQKLAYISKASRSEGPRQDYLTKFGV